LRLYFATQPVFPEPLTFKNNVEEVEPVLFINIVPTPAE